LSFHILPQLRKTLKQAFGLHFLSFLVEVADEKVEVTAICLLVKYTCQAFDNTLLGFAL
jgi:hypothetical protein